MELFDAIYTRQSVGKVKPDPIARDLIEKLLNAAAQAPNHHKVRPWRFVVLTGATRARLGEVLAQNALKRDPAVTEGALAVERAKPLRAPVLIAVGVDRPTGPKILEIENIAAVAAATQNLLLVAHAIGLAAKWRTGAAALESDVKAFLGFAPEQHILGFIYIGYPLVENSVSPQRPSAEDRTVWME